MQIKLINFWYSLKTSFWFLPALMAIAAILLSLMTTAIDSAYLYEAAGHHWWLYSGGPEGARTILSAITSSMITVAGVVFSITIVVLSQASSQFGPRLIRNFMNIKTNQMVLGTFVATYMYGILVLNKVKSTADVLFVPSFSVPVTILLSFISLGLMIYFIHTVSETIQAQNIIARVHRDMQNVVERIFPERHSGDDTSDKQPGNRDYDIPHTCDREACQVKAEHSGYLQAVDGDALLAIAIEYDLLIHLGYRPGNFITRGSDLVTVWPGHKVDERLSEQINCLFIVGAERTLEQDVEFAISQMVEIAVRALSPGINDPITAMICIDWLGDILSRLTRRRMPASHRFDEASRLRLICKSFDFEGMVDAAFNMIRQSAEIVPAVSIHLLETIATVAAQTRKKSDRDALLRQATLVTQGCKAHLSAEDDREDLERRYAAVLKAFR